QRAATFSHKNVTEFLLEAGIHGAEEALVDRRMFRLDDAQWQAFQDALDRPVQSNPRLARLLAEKSVLECRRRTNRSLPSKSSMPPTRSTRLIAARKLWIDSCNATLWSTRKRAALRPMSCAAVSSVSRAITASRS